MIQISNCKLCKSSSFLHLKKYNVNSSGYPDLKRVFGEQSFLTSLTICKSCGFVFYDNILSFEENKLLYQYDDTSSKGDPKQGMVLLERARSIIVKNIDFTKIKNAIDIGSGNFVLLESLAVEYRNVSFEAINVSYEKNLYKDLIKVHHGMLEESNSFSKEYDFVILSHILEHIGDFDSFFNNLGKIVGNNTVLYVEVPFQLGPQLFLDRNFHSQHINYFSDRTLKALLKKYGYVQRVVSFDSDGYLYYGIPGIVRAIFQKIDKVEEQKEHGNFFSSMGYLFSPWIVLATLLRKKVKEIF